MDDINVEPPIDRWATPGTQLLAVIGLLYISIKILSFWRVFASVFILPGKSLSRFGKRGSWAVVTGASDGLGKEFALQLARKGFSIVLVSRTQSKLDDLAKVIEVTHNVKTKVLAMDFSQNQDSDYAKLKELLSDLEIAVLINNVGQSHSIPVPFAETEEKEMSDIITINCMGTLKVTQLVIPNMIKRRKGLILTMASFGGLTPTPLLATYSGSKAFLQQWSSALASELKPKGITVQVVQSYLVTSAMSKIRRTSMLIPNPKQFVRATLSSIGRHGGAQGISATSTPYWSHAVLHWAITTFLGPMNTGLIFVNRKMHESIRRRALKKAQRQAKSR